ncbi:MAG: GNAT family N-acetyltransferase [Firmicutes bacterium]|nr:GNAT family N-acetyltransferase [Bacillota bacterium]
MSKKLSDMSDEELWQLFPIMLTEHQQCWEEFYEDELAVLKKALPEKQIVRIEHIGSTAVNGIWAKPIIDIIVEIVYGSDFENIRKILEDIGYICMRKREQRLSFNKGYTENGFADKVYHLHLRYAGDNDELYFRDFLKDNPNTAKEYEKLKLELWRKYEYDRDAYTDAKREFVTDYTEKAKLLYGKERYRSFIIRRLNHDEYGELEDFLYEAIFQPDEKEKAPRSIIYNPDLYAYINGFGSGQDDYCLCAELDGRLAGAVWVRNINGYGSIDEKTPEFAIAVHKEFRGRNIGTALMEDMLKLLCCEGYEQVSLSVHKENYAVKLYLETGFEIIKENEQEYIMVKRFI